MSRHLRLMPLEHGYRNRQKVDSGYHDAHPVRHTDAFVSNILVEGRRATSCVLELRSTEWVKRTERPATKLVSV